jgi:hypothetical protein
MSVLCSRLSPAKRGSDHLALMLRPWAALRTCRVPLPSEVVPRYVRKGIQKVAMALPLPISLGALRPNRGTIMGTR